MEHFLSSETIGLMLLSIIKVYLLLTFVLTVVMLIHMYRTEYKVNDRRRGRNRILELASEGAETDAPLYIQEINEACSCAS